MNETVEKIIGKKLLRGFFPGAELDTVKRAEGVVKKNNSKSYRPYIKYTPEMEKGESLKVVYYYDASIIESIEVFYNLYPSEHPEGVTAYENIVQLIRDTWSKDFEEPNHKKGGDTYYYQWTIIQDEAKYVLDMMTYDSHHRHEALGEGHKIIKIVFARRG